MNDDDENPSLTHLSDETAPLDLKATEQSIAEGALAKEWLDKNAGLSWSHWSRFIKGLRSLRDLTFSIAKTRDLASQSYKQTLNDLLRKPKYAAYIARNAKERKDRSDCYALMDHIEDVDLWYATLAPHDQRRWNHPNTIKKHCDPQFVSGGMGHNQPPRAAANAKKAKPRNLEADGLREVLLKFCRAILNAKSLKTVQAEAVKLLDHLADPDDSVADIGNDEEDAE